jgi:chitinase
VTRLDFDIEGGVLSDTASTARRDQALAALQAENPAVQVDFTLAVAPNGLPTGTGSEYALLQDAKSKGVKVSEVNLMTMDFGDGQNALNDAESAAQASAEPAGQPVRHLHRRRLQPDRPDPDRRPERRQRVLHHRQRQTLETFAANNGVQELSFWEVDGYDKGTGYQYSSIFNQITGASGGTRPRRPARPVRSPATRVCAWTTVPPAPRQFNPIQVYTCNGTNAQSWTVESNGTLQTLGECLDVTGAGTANGTLVDLYTCNGTAAQVWQHQSNGELINPNSGKCLDDTGFGGSGTQVQIWACADSSNQQWNIP